MSSVQSIYINKTVMCMQVGTCDVLHVHTLPVDAEDNEIEWEIEDTTVVSLNNNIGQLIALSEGKSSITIYLKSDHSISAKCMVYVVEDIAVKSISFPVPELTMNVNNTMQLGVIITPTNATNRKVYWSSCCPDIATVDSDGIVRPQSPGVVDIYATTEDRNLTAKCTITIEQYVPVRSIRFGESELTLKKSQTKKLTAIVEPSNATYPQVIWHSCCPDVATVDSSGKITPRSPGYADIYATTVDGNFTAYCTVRVVIEDVIIKKVNYFTEVHFESGKIWKCINKDMIYNTENISTLIVNRANYNILATDENGVLNGGYKTYSNEELKLLYAIDPYGVAAYIARYADDVIRKQTYLNDEEALKKVLKYKDDKFKMLFNREPRYFAPTDAGEWIETYDKRNPENVISESESYFGTHGIGEIDGIRILANIVDIGANILTLMIGERFPGTAKFIKGVAFIAKIGIYYYYDEYIESLNEIGDHIAENLIKLGVNYQLENGKKLDEFVEPIYNVLSTLNNVDEILDELSNKKTYYCATIDYCTNKVDYNVKLALPSGSEVDIPYINKLIS